MTATGAVIPDVFLSNEAGSGFEGSIWRCAGLHPMHASDISKENLKRSLREKLESGSFAAIGEFGLDRILEARHSRERQEEAFEVQLELSEAFQLPIVLHVVRRHGRVLELLGTRARAGMVHDFQGSSELAEQYLARGLSLSVGPSVLDPRHKKARIIAMECPLERLLLETDAEVPEHASRLLDVRREVAKLRNIGERELSAAVDRNVQRLFGLAEKSQ